MATKTYRTVSPERQKAMSGLEFVKGLASGLLPLNTIEQTLGSAVPTGSATSFRYHCEAGMAEVL